MSTTITLAWDPNSEPDLAGYRLYYGTQSLNYTTVLDVGNVTSASVDVAGPGPYYFALTAYNTSGQEGAFAPELVWPEGTSFAVPAGRGYQSRPALRRRRAHPSVYQIVGRIPPATELPPVAIAPVRPAVMS